MIDSIKYMRAGERFCVPCYMLNGLNQLHSVLLNAEDTQALGREVFVCVTCKNMSIGEKIPEGLRKFFENFPEDDIPGEEKVAV